MIQAARKLIVPAIAVAAIALPSGAGAAIGQFWGGPVAGGANNAGMEFNLTKKHHKPHKVLKFNWHNIPGCPQNSFDGKGFNMRVNHHGKFHGSFQVPNTFQTATVHGKFKHHNHKAVGTLAVSNCTSGPLPWTATKGG